MGHIGHAVNKSSGRRDEAAERLRVGRNGDPPEYATECPRPSQARDTARPDGSPELTPPLRSALLAPNRIRPRLVSGELRQAWGGRVSDWRDALDEPMGRVAAPHRHPCARTRVAKAEPGTT